MSGYNGSLGFATTGLILALMSAPAFGRDDLDVTMRLVGENEDVTESVAREIRLPELPALERRSSGLGRGDGEPPGQQIREQAHEKGGILVSPSQSVPATFVRTGRSGLVPTGAIWL